MFAFRRLGGNFKAEPEEWEVLSDEAHELLAQCFEGIDPKRGGAVDHHTHIVGIGTHGSGCCVNSVMRKPILHPINWVKFKVFQTAAGVSDEERGDQEYVERLLRLVSTARHRYAWGPHYILAMDRWYSRDGIPSEPKTGIYTPNEYVFELAEKHPTKLIACPSIHPYRKDAINEARQCHKRGARFIKWLPNSQGIKVDDEEIIGPFYDELARLGMALLIHVGHENSIDSGGVDQSLGNPLSLRCPLDHGVKVVAAHCASEGTNTDWDDPQRPKRSNFELFLRLMDEPKYEKLLFADISSTTLFKRVGVPLTTILDRSDLHHRLINGSDYPVICINIVVHTSQLVRYGYITTTEKALLDEIYSMNPLLFDFAVKRCIRSPNTGNKFSLDVFHANDAVLPLPRSAYPDWADKPQ